MSPARVAPRTLSVVVAGSVVALVAGGAGLAAVTGSVGGDGTSPATLASFADTSRSFTGLNDDEAQEVNREIRRPGPRQPEAPIPLGTPDAPFAPLPTDEAPRAVISPTGLAMPIIESREDGWLVSTACQAVQFLSRATPVGRAHVVLDPGHGGAEPGAVSPGGLVEKDLNLAVARETARLLTEAGATVVLTRDGDHTMTAAARGLVARAVGPALLVSIHHNGGAPPGPGGPGTIVFSKAESPESTRFGGLFHQALIPVLEEAAIEPRAAHEAWTESVEAYDQAKQALDASQAAEQADDESSAGQDPAGTQPAPPTSPPTLPDPPEGEPVPPFLWAGSGNAGVRSWIRDDGQDVLAVLRHAGPSPAALVEFLYMTNPSEEALLASEGFLETQAEVLAEAVTRYLAGEQGGTGFVADQAGDQPIGGGGARASCVEPDLGQPETPSPAQPGATSVVEEDP